MQEQFLSKDLSNQHSVQRTKQDIIDFILTNKFHKKKQTQFNKNIRQTQSQGQQQYQSLLSQFHSQQQNKVGNNKALSQSINYPENNEIQEQIQIFNSHNMDKHSFQSLKQQQQKQKQLQQQNMFKSQDIEKSKGVSYQSEPSLISRTVAHSKIYLTQQYEEYPYRWINFIIFLLACLVQAVSMHAFTPVANQIKNIYNIQSSSVTLPALLFMVVSPPAMILANFITDKFGIKLGTTVGGLLLIIGTGLKCLVNKGFIFVYIGSCVNGAANNLILNSPSKVASNWFKPVNSGLIGVFFTLAILTSTTWGVFIPPFFINQTSNESSVFNLLFFEFILTSSAMILMIVLLKESPPTPPSQVSKEEKASFLPQIKILFSNKNYILIFLVMGLLLGGYSGFISVIAFYFKPYDIDSNSTSLMILGCTIGGAFSSVIIGFYVKKTKKLKFTAIIGLLGSLSMFALIQLTLNIIPNFALLCVAFTITGCTVFPVIPCLLELGSEVSYPVSQPIATGFLFCSQQLFGFIIGFLSSYILEISEIWAYIYFQAIFVFAFILMIMVKEEFLRTKQNLCSTINIEGDIDAIEEIDIQDITEQLSVQGIL